MHLEYSPFLLFYCRSCRSLLTKMSRSQWCERESVGEHLSVKNRRCPLFIQLCSKLISLTCNIYNWRLYLLPSADVSLIHHFSNIEEKVKWSTDALLLFFQMKIGWCFAEKFFLFFFNHLGWILFCLSAALLRTSDLFAVALGNGVCWMLEVLRFVGTCQVLSHKRVDMRVFLSSWLSSFVMSLCIEIQADRRHYLRHDVYPSFIVQEKRFKEHQKGRLAVFSFAFGANHLEVLRYILQKHKKALSCVIRSQQVLLPA